MARRRYYAFLRAINTGGRRLTNERLVEPFHRLGLEEVAAYQAAGNVTFVTDAPALADPDGLSVALGEAYGFPVPTLVRTEDEARAIVAARPFGDDELAATAGRVQVAFMAEAPDDGLVAAVDALVPSADRVVVRGREWFWLPVDGITGSTLPVGSIEALVGPMTIRTLGTVRRMVGRFSGAV